jgi:hypothetical protein
MQTGFFRFYTSIPTRCVSEGLFTTRCVSFEVAIFLGFRAEGPAIYLAQPIGLVFTQFSYAQLTKHFSRKLLEVEHLRLCYHYVWFDHC